MSLAALMSRTAVITRRSQTGTADEDNVPTWVESSPVTVSAYLEQTEATEVVVGRETHVSDHLLVVPAGTDIDASDEVTIEGSRYKVIGPPNHANSPRGEHHIELRLEATEG